MIERPHSSSPASPDGGTPSGADDARPGGDHRARWLALPVIAAAALVVGVIVMPPDTSELTGAGSRETLPEISLPVPSTTTVPSGTSADPTAAPTDPAAIPPATEAPSSVAPAPSSSDAASEVPADPGASAQPTALAFPAASIDMAILPLTPSGEDLATQQLVPPLTPDAYWLTNYGGPGNGSKDTTYIVGHSWDGKDAPFNRLSNEALVGTEFTLTTAAGKLTYVVDSVITHDKDTLKDLQGRTAWCSSVATRRTRGARTWWSAPHRRSPDRTPAVRP
jgi:hypothetical protein